MQKRIRKADALNWVVEEFSPGGEIAARGRTAGKPKAARWIIIGYYNSLKNAALGMLDDVVGEEPTIKGSDIILAIEKAEKTVIAALPKDGSTI